MSTALLTAKDIMGEPGPALREAQARAWYAQTEVGKAILRYAEVQRLLRDRRFRNMGTELMERQGIADGPVRRTYEAFLLSMEGDEHARRRGLVRAAFDRRHVESMRPRMRTILHALLDRACAQGRFDFVTAVAAPFPTQIIAQILGLDLSPDDAEVTQACADLGYIVGLEVREHVAAIEAALRILHGRLEVVMAARRVEQRDDVLSALVSGERGDGGLSDDKALATAVTLLFGGLDTTRRTFANAFALLLEHPDQWQLLKEKPELATSATEEVLRFAPGTRVAVRVAMEDLDFEGLPIRSGELVYAATGAANRDPRVYADPDRFDIARAGPPPLTMGGGPHVCLGAGLARAELQEGLPIMSTRLGGVRRDGPILWRTAMEGSPGPMSIPLRVGA